MYKKILNSLILASTLSFNVHAFNLGDIEIHSALNEPLDAEILIVGALPYEVDSLLVKLAADQDFLRPGISRPFLLTNLKFKVDYRADRTPVIKVTTHASFHEPSLDFLLDVEWLHGHLVREYTLLVPSSLSIVTDTATVTEALAVEGSALIERVDDSSNLEFLLSDEPPVVNLNLDIEAEVLDIEVEVEDRSEIQPQPIVSSSYTVKSGDIMLRIAEQFRSQKVDINQAMLAIMRYNPEAFIRGNVNLVRKGQILRIPDEKAMLALSSSDAMIEFQRQNVLWGEYRTQLASTQTQSSETTKNLKNNAVSNSTRLALIAPGKDEESRDFAAGEQDGSNELRHLERTLSWAKEKLVASKLEQDELQSRISDLEKIVTQSEGVINLKSQQLAQIQAANEATVDATQVMEADVDESLKEDARPSGLGGIIYDNILPSWRSSLLPILDSPLLFVILALPILIVFLFVRKRKKNLIEVVFEDENLLETESVAKADDSVKTMFSVPKVEVESKSMDDAQYDIMAAVDVYLTHGLYDEASDVLKTSISENPDIIAYRGKLLKTYYNAGKKDDFIAESQILSDYLSGQSSTIWDEVVVMGKEMAPDNMLFSDSKAEVSGELKASDLSIAKPDRADLNADDGMETDVDTEDLNNEEIETKPD